MHEQAQAIPKDFKSTLTPGKVAYAYGLALKMMESRNEGWAQIGLRAARRRDPMLLAALERMAEVTSNEQEAQFGQTMRSTSATYGETRGTTEHQMCHKAYEAADKGEPIVQLQWVYGSAAWLCGFNL